jgi:two-component system CheB/CheR fusion protein
MTFSIVGQDGRRRWLEVSNRGEAVGEEWAGVIVLRDVSDRSIRRLQDRFMAAASHELRTPVAALHGYLQLAVRDSADGSPALRRRLDQALDETRRLGDLVSRLFDVALIQHGHMALRPERMDLVAMLREVVEQALTIHPHATIELSAGRSLPIDADPQRLRQVFQNLVLNAIEHGDPRSVRVTVAREGRDAVVRVTDRGPGIPETVTGRLFEPFQAGWDENESSGQGLGLGLFVAHEIVAAHRGTIGIAPATGGGTVATVTLPAPARARRTSEA